MKKIIYLLVFVLQISYTFAQTKVVLVEQFSNSGCPTCAVYTPPIVNWVQSNDSNACMLVYHTPFPYNDSMYHENSIESDARVAFYNVVGVPHSILDGNYYRANSSTFGNNISTQVNNRLATATAYDLSLKQAGLSENIISGSVDFTTTGTSFEANLRGFIVAVEEEVLKNSYAASPGNNSETKYEFVMRKFLTSVEGVVLGNGIDPIAQNISFSWELNNFKRSSELRILAFVQNIQTKEILNARYWNPTQPVGTNAKTSPKILLYPNPSAGETSLQLAEAGSYRLEVLNINGQLLYHHQGEALATEVITIPQLPAGLYTLRVISNNEILYGKLIQN